ncbi:MAG: type IV-A pilus assembly ATPase PilB [Desulfobacterales bacterium]|nr:type IV-A pilus assembly ATPase PilB [Desulfobacterales bacterium]MBF0395689.1 type IV-A pilus assembly ATPase PilB [Desulfobacterales bacterium]
MAKFDPPKRPISSSFSSKPGHKSSSLNATIRDQSGAGKTRIGEILSKEGYITSNQLQEALDYQKKHEGRLGSILIRLGYIEQTTIVNVLSRVQGYPAVTISQAAIDPKAISIMPYETAKKYMAFPLKFKGDDLVVCMAEPTDTSLVENLQKEIQKGLSVCVATEKDIVDAFKNHYKITEEEYNSFFASKEVEEDDDIPLTQVDDFGSIVSEAVEDLEVDKGDDIGADNYSANDAPIIKLVAGILTRAVNEGVSDIHIEPFEKEIQIRYRLDGELYKAMKFPLSIINALISRIKILAGLNIAERRVPQDGRIKMKLGKKKAIDFRVSCLPTLFGESVVMRILDQSALTVDFAKLGFEDKTYKIIEKCIDRPYGLLLVTGPTGSGKTTTLYSILNMLNNEDTKILTAEDPVEFNFKGINQVHVKDEVGMTFAAALKAFLRQDPDIIMVGEIRDITTAEIAIKAAMTGHLVLSTLHTNDCPATIGRLIDIGIPSYMVASAVTMVLAQRLCRKLCPNCKVIVKDYSPEELELFGFSKEEIPSLVTYGPKGCSTCKNIGYKGRLGLYEIMEVTEEVGKAINSSVSESQLRKVAVKEGMDTLRDAGLIKVRKGVTSIDEIVKNTTLTKEALPAYLINPDIEEYDDKAIIIREGNKDNDFFKLIQGSLYVIKDGKKIAEISQPGDYFGEMSAITGEPRSATIISNQKSKIKRFPGNKLIELIQNYPDIAKLLFTTIANRLHRADQIIINLLNERKQRPN